MVPGHPFNEMKPNSGDNRMEACSPTRQKTFAEDWISKDKSFDFINYTTMRANAVSFELCSKKDRASFRG
jgi:hypothetical protein